MPPSLTTSHFLTRCSWGRLDSARRASPNWSQGNSPPSSGRGWVRRWQRPSVLSGFLLRPTTDKAVLFIDEIHELPVSCQTALYRAMEEGVVFVPQPYTNAITKMQTVRFTLMSATTDPQLLLPPLRDRFRLVCQMQPYSSDEIAAILRQRVRQLGWQVDEACFEAIAVRSFGTPRIAIRLLESAYRTARSEGGTFVDYGHLLRTLALEQLDEYGLGSDEQKYLLLLSEASAPVRVGVLAGKMRTTHLVLSQVIEERLLYLDLIERQNRPSRNDSQETKRERPYDRSLDATSRGEGK